MRIDLAAGGWRLDAGLGARRFERVDVLAPYRGLHTRALGEVVDAFGEVWKAPKKMIDHEFMILWL